MNRKKSTEKTRKVTPPSPTYMDNGQFAAYLADLRNNRIARPGGARPLPTTSRRTALIHPFVRMNRKKSTEKTRKVTPPSPTYMDNGQFAAYLADLRNNRIARPGGARPLPTTTTIQDVRSISFRQLIPMERTIRSHVTYYSPYRDTRPG
ncbi:hypothetical protein HYQ46_002714 [Verticillium longisporum]|nr:hypothetical protein HYQ46_002714 [Verticillium longisporum]